MHHIDRMDSFIYDRKLDYEDNAKDIFDISLLPEAFRWSAMPELKKGEEIKIAARELKTYAWMLRNLFEEAIKQRLEDGRMPRVVKSNGTWIAAQKVGPGTYAILESLLYLAARS